MRDRPSSTFPASQGGEIVPALTARMLSCLERPAWPHILDLRSPKEFAHDHLPNAHNIPLLDDEERALVGLLYVQHSPEEAFRKGSEIVLAKVERLIAEIGEIVGWRAASACSREYVEAWTSGGIGRLQKELVVAPETMLAPGSVLLYCWRGGLRSRAVVALLRRLGMGQALILAGGYRAWRAEIMADLQRWPARTSYVLRGLTGVGKTLVLRALEHLRPGLTVDLEALAGHRSSLLGMVGLAPCSQKTFESRLHSRSRDHFLAATVLEGESRKVGDAIIPPALWHSLETGVNIELHASQERRIDVLIEDYLANPAHQPKLREQLLVLEARLSARVALAEMLDQGRVRELVQYLLEHYYDPLYRHSEKGRGCSLRVDSNNPKQAAECIVHWLEQRHGSLTRTSLSA